MWRGTSVDQRVFIVPTRRALMVTRGALGCPHASMMWHQGKNEVSKNGTLWHSEQWGHRRSGFCLTVQFPYFHTQRLFFSRPLEVITDQKCSVIIPDDTSLFDQRTDSLTPDLTLRINLQICTHNIPRNFICILSPIACPDSDSRQPLISS